MSQILGVYMWAGINLLHPLSAHVDTDSKNQYPQMKIAVLGDADNNRIRVPFISNIYFLYFCIYISRKNVQYLKIICFFCYEFVILFFLCWICNLCFFMFIG